MNLTMMYKKKDQIVEKEFVGSGGIRTHASEETGALNQRLRPLGHATFLSRSLQIWASELFSCSNSQVLQNHRTNVKGGDIDLQFR